MKQPVKFSVTIPAYKDQFLKQAIDSVLQQTYTNFELVIVNDASPNDLDSIVAQFTDDRIRYFKNKVNCGAENVVDNWNICLSHATGDYMMCIGDDDMLTPRCLQDFADLIAKYPQAELLHAHTDSIDEDSNYVSSVPKRAEWESVYSLVYTLNDSGLGSYLYNVEALRRDGGFFKLPYGWSSDLVSAIIAARRHGAANTQEPGFLYRGTRHSISHDIKSIEGKVKANQMAWAWIRDFISQTPAVTPEDKQLERLIPERIDEKFFRKIDELIEFDIRKNFGQRAPFWLRNRREFGLSLKRYLLCVLRSFRYRL